MNNFPCVSTVKCSSLNYDTLSSACIIITDFFAEPKMCMAQKKQKSRDVKMSRDLYVLCLVMLHQQFDTMLKCFIIKKKSVYRLKHFLLKSI